MQDERALRIYCPTHKTSFMTAGESRIVCESGGEALAWNFPHEEFWGYCCGCQSFWPSGIQKGSSAENSCPVCGREVAKRYLCGFCKVISLDSDDVARRKPFSVAERGPVEPSCPGCLKATPAALCWHRCGEAAAEFATPLKSCPFCSESLVEDSRVTERPAAGGRAPAPQPTFDVRPAPPAAPARREDARTAYAATAAPHGFAASAERVASSYDSQSLTAEPKSWVRPFLIAALVTSLGALAVLSVLLVQSLTHAERSSPAATNSGAATPSGTASANRKSRTAPGANGNLQRQPPSAAAAPTAGAKLAYCRSNQVFLRSEPHLDQSDANVIRVLNRDEKLWALGTSTNYDTTYIRSAGGEVTDNWTEVQLYDDPAVRGWVFSYFVLY